MTGHLTAEQIELVARRAGHTRRVACFASGSVADLYGYVRPGANLDDVFTLIDEDDGTILNVRGWLYSVEQIEEEA